MIERKTAYNSVETWVEFESFMPGEFIRFDHNTSYRINGIVYTEYSDSFRIAFNEDRQKLLMWTKLNND